MLLCVTSRKSTLRAPCADTTGEGQDGGSPSTAPPAPLSPHAPAGHVASAILVQWPLSSPDSNTQAAGQRVQNHHEHLVHNPTCLSTRASPFLEWVDAKVYGAASTVIWKAFAKSDLAIPCEGEGGVMKSNRSCTLPPGSTGATRGSPRARTRRFLPVGFDGQWTTTRADTHTRDLAFHFCATASSSCSCFGVQF